VKGFIEIFDSAYARYINAIRDTDHRSVTTSASDIMSVSDSDDQITGLPNLPLRGRRAASVKRARRRRSR
jgi:hypothetical protein